MDVNEMPTVVHAEPADLIATVWYGLGRRPRESLVLIGLHGPRRRVGALLGSRLIPEDSVGPPAFAVPGRVELGRMLRRVAEAGASAVVAVVFAEAALAVPIRRIVPRLRAEAPAAGLPLVDVLGVTSGAYRSLLCRFDECCPPEGRPIAEVESSQTAVLHVLRGAREGGADPLGGLDPVCGPDPMGGLDPMGGPAPVSAADGLTVDQRRDWFDRWSTAMESSESPAALADGLIEGLGAALADRYLRDAVFLQVVGLPTDQIGHLLLGAERFRLVPGLNRAREDAQTQHALERPPRPEATSRADACLLAAGRTVSPGARGPVLTVLAMLAWYDQRPSRARWLATRARVEMPEQSLPRLIDQLLAARVPPPWSVSRE
jgi:Domain of unknown function (DUF4192)